MIRVVSSAHESGADSQNEFFEEMIEGWAQMLDNLSTHFDEAA